MIKIFIMFVVAAVFAVIAFCSFLMAEAENRMIKNELKEQKENESKNAEIMAEASKTKDEAVTGNISNDVAFMGNKLHEYATKKDGC